MRALWGGFICAMVLVGGAQAAPLWRDWIGPHWDGGAYTSNETGAFNHCAASAKYKNGIFLTFMVGKSFVWKMSFASPKWSLTTGTEYDVSYRVDDKPAYFTRARAVADNQVRLELKDSTPLFNALRRGRTLYVNAQGTDLAFNLTDTSMMLDYLLKCVANGGAKPASAVAATPNPFGTPSSVDLKAEATLLAANLISELGITGFKFLMPEEMPKGIPLHAVWAAEKTIGTIQISPATTDINAVGPLLIGSDAKGCKRAFASGALPPEGDSKIASVFTRCGLGEEALVVFYIVAPRKAGGVYVIGTTTFGDEQEESIKTTDGVKSAVLHVLAKQ
jgi:hypothetical protein